MRILHVIPSLAAGGAEKLLSDTLPIMVREFELEVELLLLSDSNSVFEESIYNAGIKIHVSPYLNSRNPRHIAFIANVINQGQYDIVHSHLFPCNYFVAFAKAIYRLNPILITTEHSTHNKRRDKPYLKSLEKCIYSLYSKIIAISEQTKTNLVDWVQCDNNKIVLIHNGIDTDFFESALPYNKEELSIDFNSRSKLICMVGSFREQKDQKTLIRALKLLANDVFLILVGSGKLQYECKKLVNDLELDDRVLFLGVRKDVARIMKTVDVIVLSSHWEGFGLVAAEGMAAGKPVIASDVPGLSEVVEEAGILFEKGNEKELATILCQLFDDATYYTNIANRCSHRVKKYDIKYMVTEQNKLYNKLIINGK